jgi:hypothetical protein
MVPLRGGVGLDGDRSDVDGGHSECTSDVCASA